MADVKLTVTDCTLPKSIRNDPKLIKDYEIEVGQETLRLRVFPEFLSIGTATGQHQIVELGKASTPAAVDPRCGADVEAELKKLRFEYDNLVYEIDKAGYEIDYDGAILDPYAVERNHNIKALVEAAKKVVHTFWLDNRVLELAEAVKRFEADNEPTQPAAPEVPWAEAARIASNLRYQQANRIWPVVERLSDASDALIDLARKGGVPPESNTDPRPHGGSGCAPVVAQEELTEESVGACGRVVGPKKKIWIKPFADWPVVPTAVYRYFDERMKNPEFAAEYHKERAYSSLDDWFIHRKAFNDALKKHADSLGITPQEAYDRMLGRAGGQ